MAFRRFLVSLTFSFTLRPSYTNLTRIPWSYTGQIWTSYVKAFESYRLTNKQTDRQRDRQTYTTEIIHHAASRVVNQALQIDVWLEQDMLFCFGTR